MKIIYVINKYTKNPHLKTLFNIIFLSTNLNKIIYINTIKIHFSNILWF